MAGSSFGNIFRVTTWGESHGKGVGVVVDGVPAGLPLTEADIQEFLNRRKPGQSRYATPRKEDDTAEILSGVFEGRTTGTPISIVIYNKTARSSDYSEIASYYRPGHADYTFDEKYGFRDYRGGGRSSGRETIGRVAGGAIAQQILRQCGISVRAYTRSIGPVSISDTPVPEGIRTDCSADNGLMEAAACAEGSGAAKTAGQLTDHRGFDLEEMWHNPLFMPDAAAAKEAAAYADRMMAEHDSLGGVIECVIDGMPKGLGDPVFEKLNANLAKAICSIGSVKGFEIGDGFAVSRARGSENNDAFCLGPDGQVTKRTNHAGGILGGMSDGSRITLRAAIKPTPSIARPQQTVNQSGQEIDISIGGRHDPLIVPRAVVVVECMAALVIADALMMNMTARMDYLTDFYKSR